MTILDRTQDEIVTTMIKRSDVGLTSVSPWFSGGKEAS